MSGFDAERTERTEDVADFASIRDHLEAALDSTSDQDGRFHIRQALQLVDALERNPDE